jgi:hypothetical protein
MIENQTKPSPGIVSAVRKALQGEIDFIVDQEAKAAGERTEKRVRERTAQIAATILQRMDMSYNGNELIIRVEFVNDANL